MTPLVALVGRPNVGKSTLFNALTKTRDALVHDMPGVTRDRKIGQVSVQERSFDLVDTGGVSSDAEALDAQTVAQTKLALEDADVICFIVDARAGCLPEDEDIAHMLRMTHKPVLLFVNKADGLDERTVLTDFFSLGFKTVLPISASHRRGLQQCLDALLDHFPEQEVVEADDAEEGEDVEHPSRIKFAIIGRPNVGKSTLTNRILGEQRVIEYDHPGTTRDAISIEFERHDVSYTVVDTAGIRRKARVHESIEKFSVIKALDSLDMVDVAVVLLDATEGVTDQDSHIISAVIDKGAGLVVAFNKWDHLTEEQRNACRNMVDRKFAFIKDTAKVLTLSAKHGTGMRELFDAVSNVHKRLYQPLSTGQINQVLQSALDAHQPPSANGRRIKCRYAHCGSRKPFTIVIHGTQVNKLASSYQRYLTNVFREAFKLEGVPIRLVMRTTDNPYQP